MDNLVGDLKKRFDHEVYLFQSAWEYESKRNDQRLYGSRLHRREIKDDRHL